MAEHRPPISIRPRPRPARAIGALNVVFGTFLLAASWLALNGSAFNGLAAAPNAVLERALLDQTDREHRERLSNLKALEAGTRSESAREVYRAERERLEAKGPSLAFEVQMIMIGDRMRPLAIWGMVDAVTAFALNLLLIASGVLILQRIEWGRNLGIWTAGLKIARLVAVYVVFLAAVVPPTSRALGELVGESIAARGGGMPAGMPNMTQLYAITYSAWGVAMLVLGPIYPIITLFVLSRPAVRAACEPAAVRGPAMLREATRS